MVARPLLHAARVARSAGAAVRRPLWAAPGHFYSPITSDGDVERAVSWAADAPELPGVDLRAREQLALARELDLGETPPDRYRPGNGMYDAGDAALYRALLRRFRPRRVVEVGSGYSTAVLLDTAERDGLDVAVTCIEPFPDRLLGLLRPGDDVELVQSLVQDVPLDIYTSLGAGDLLFIDSSHVAKAGSDVVWLYLRVLPRLAPGVLVHVHDVAWPFEYQEGWLRERRNWNEAYLLNAFLCHNHEWELLLFSSWLWRAHPELVPETLRSPEPGSVWMRRITP